MKGSSNRKQSFVETVARSKGRKKKKIKFTQVYNFYTL